MDKHSWALGLGEAMAVTHHCLCRTTVDGKDGGYVACPPNLCERTDHHHTKESLMEHDQAEALSEHLQFVDEMFMEVIVEQNTQQRIRCEKRGEEVVFIFDAGGDYKNVVHADTYLGLLNKLRENPSDSQYGVHNEVI